MVLGQIGSFAEVERENANIGMKGSFLSLRVKNGTARQRDCERRSCQGLHGFGPS
jgi:hypothetical protein